MVVHSFSDIVKLSHSPAAAIPIVKQLWLEFFLLKLAHFFIVGKKVVLTNGFIKKTQKTPKEELERAKQYRAEYLSRKERDLP